MTRIDRLTLQGFKSFADRVSIPFPHGFTVICGPNGSGKSNISDSIMFALGISSAKMIRAEKLVNLIFHGTKKRGPAKYCLVSLYLDNRDKKLPFDEEIKITRKVSDRGLAIFRLNGKVVTRNKILDLLSNIHLSPYGYNIIMQGDMNRIIEMSNIERREIVDQMAGITEFDDKKKKAMSELEKVEKHVTEMQIIRDEKEKLISKLKIEKENADRYAVLSREADRIRASLVNSEKSSVEQGAEEHGKKLEDLSKQFDEINSLCTEKDREYEAKRKQAKKIGDILITRSRDYELTRKIDSINMEMIRKADRIEYNEKEITRAQVDETARAVMDIKGVVGAFSQVVSIPEKYSVAIKTAAGRHMSDIIVETTDVALECVDFLKQKKIGRGRFIPMDKIRSRRIELKDRQNTSKYIIGHAADLIKYDSKYQGAVNYVLGNVLVSDDLQDARNINENAKISTLEGDLIESAGAIIGGYHRQGSREIMLIKENEKLRNDIEKLSQELQELQGKAEKETEKSDDMKKERDEIEQNIDNMRVEVEKLFQKRNDIQSKINKLNYEKARKDAEIENLKVEMEKYRDVKDLYSETPEKLRQMLKKAMDEITAMGPINMKASEEFQTISVEYEELRKKLDRLTGERDAILNSIAEIEKKRYEKFFETLQVISGNFSKVYFDLMKGDGRLRLEEEGNINSGLIIEATTETKKILNIDAMSGGEKSLTALGFLFAIQQYHASPFYILDEIDAALDKVNVKKVVDFVKKYSSETQFIIISHNDITIQAADNVFGVSMEDGVSKIFSIKMPGAKPGQEKLVDEKEEEDESWEGAEEAGTE